MKPIQILQLEDNRADAELLKETLRAEFPCEVICVQTRADFQAALQGKQFDLIISDHTLPAFDGLSALTLAKAQAPDTPFIFVSGTIQEEAAIESLKRGATDYVLKDRPGRLVSAVRRAVEKAREQLERKKLQDQLYRAQRMEGLGALAAGIAHDLNNLLVPIRIASELLAEETDEQQRRQIVATLKSSAQRASEMVGRILQFARGTVSQWQAIDIKELFAEIVRLTQGAFSSKVKINTSVEPDLRRVIGNTTQLHQVLMNLCLNARDAMPNGGTLTLSAAAVTLKKHLAKGEFTAVSGDYVVITVADTGSGMPPEILDHIFEPFFTTKGEGKGTGLGLATALGITQNHGGFLEVASTPSRGSAFKVYLPLDEKAVTGAATATKSAS